MAESSNDSWTQLSLGTQNGDYMDESAVTYPSGAAGTDPTTRKRERIVPSGDGGEISMFQQVGPQPQGYDSPLPGFQGVFDASVLACLTAIRGELKQQTKLLHAILSAVGDDDIGDDEVNEIGEDN